MAHPAWLPCCPSIPLHRAAAVAVIGVALSLTGPVHADPPPPAAPAVPAPTVDLVDVRELPLGDAVRILSDEMGLNLAASAEASKVNVTLHLRGVTPMEVIDTLVRTHGLYYKREEPGGVIRIYTVAEYKRDLNTFRDDRTRVFTLMYPNATDAAMAIRDLYGDRVQLSLGADGQEQTDDLQDRFDRFDILNERSQGLGLFSGGGTSGGYGGGQFSGGGGYGGGRSGGFSRRSDLLRQSRQQSPAESSRSRDLLKDLSPEEIQKLESEASGRAGSHRAAIDDLLRRRGATIFVTVVKRHNQVIVRSSDEQTLDGIAALMQRLDVPTPLVLLEVKVMSVDLTNGFQSAFDFQFKSGEAAGGFASGDILAPLAGAMSPTGGGLIPGALAFQYVGSQFRARLQLLENQNRVTMLATPLLLTANNEVSRLFVGEEVPLNRGFGGSQTIVGESTLVTPGTTTIEFRPVGTTLIITPNINADRTVTLRILQEVSNISANPATVLVPTSTGFVPEQVDVVQSRSFSGTVVAKDGLAVAVGGLIQEEVKSDEQKVPVLGELPVFGILFRRENKGRDRHEIVIMIRPYVLNTPAESDQISRRLLEQLSLHPNSPDAHGQLGTYSSKDVLRPAEKQEQLRHYFRFNSLAPEGRE